MKPADQVIGPATTAGFPWALSPSICGKLRLNMDGWYCKMPSSSQAAARASCNLRRVSSAPTTAGTPATGPAAAMLSLMPGSLRFLLRNLYDVKDELQAGQGKWPNH